MNDGRIALAQQFPGLRFLDAPAKLTVLAASSEGGKVIAKGDDGRLRIRSLVSTPRVNSYGFRIAPAAFVEAGPMFAENPVMLAYHRGDWPVGRWDEGWTVTENGLVLEGWISAAEPQIQEKVLDGTLGRTSIAFWPLGEEQDDDDVTVITKLRLFEVSLVPIPADAGTMVEPLKAPEPALAAPALAVVERERVQDEDHEVVALGVADACRATLGALSSLGQAGRIAAGLRRVSIQRGGE